MSLRNRGVAVSYTHLEPRLTVIAQPIDQLAKQSARLISRLVNGKTYRNKKVLLDAELKVGNTTRNL